MKIKKLKIVIITSIFFRFLLKNNKVTPNRLRKVVNSKRITIIFIQINLKGLKNIQYIKEINWSKLIVKNVVDADTFSGLKPIVIK